MGIQCFKCLWFLLWVLFISPTHGFAQSSNIGTPPISNFYKKDYKGSPQSWDIAQSGQGIMYFANNEGLLEFDGIHWRCYKVSNQSNIRSVETSENNRIYVGAQGELGYFQINETGAFVYHSFKHLLPEQDHNFADVWDIEIIEDRVFFRTGNAVYLYQNDRIDVIYRGQAINLLAKVADEIFIHDTDKGLLKYNNETFIPVLQQPFFSQKEISGIFSFSQDTLLVSTIYDGLYLIVDGQKKAWPINDNKVFINSSIYCATEIDETNYAFGTSTKGVFIVNKKGQVTRQINAKVGLQVNNVLCLFTDRSKNLWAGLDNGIDLIETSSPFTNIFADGDLKATGYAIQIHDGQIFFGTANGVYSNDWKSYYNPTINSPYQLVEGSEGQVWNLSVHGEDLFINHHRGAFVLKNNAANPIPSNNGAWLQLPIGKNKLLSGQYDGFSILELKDNEWRMTTDFQNDWQESCRIIVQDERGNFWVSHPYRGLFKVQFNTDYSKLENVQQYNSKHGFPSDFQIYVFKIGEEVVFCAEHGVYTYNEEKDRFEPNEKWNTIFGWETRVQRLIEAPNGDIWFVTNNEVGVLDVKDAGIYKNIKKRVFPQLKNRLVNAFEEIYPYDEENVFIALEDGFMHYNPQQAAADTNFYALIRHVKCIKTDSILFNGNPSSDHPAPLIDYKNNALHFTFSATYFGNLDNNQFQYFLEGYDQKWSAWAVKSQMEYTNLKAGNYTFHLRAKNINGHISNTTAYKFRISPPWYASRTALIIYALLIGAAIFSLVFFPKKRFEREKAAMQSEQKKTLQQKEQEHHLIEQQRRQQISQLEKEKLELKIQSKNQELASSTMHLVQKSEMLQKIKDDIQKIAKSADNDIITSELRKIIRKISADERLDNDWELFANHFDQVHNDFLHRLGSKHPQLTLKDQRLCAYLRINLSSKEMASLMNISVRSVEVARYRLRKKLGIDSDVNLAEFMMQV